MKTTAYSRAKRRVHCNGLHHVTDVQYSGRIKHCAQCDNSKCVYKGVQCWKVASQWARCPLKKWDEIVKVKGRLAVGVVI